MNLGKKTDKQAMTAHRRKEIAALTQRKYRERLGQTLVEGLRSVEAAVEIGASLVEVLVSAQSCAVPRIQALLNRIDVPVHVLPERDLARFSSVQASSGVLAVAQTVLVPEVSLHALRTLLVLDGVQDPGNVGALLRTAAWFGVDGVLAGPGTADFFNPKAVRAAMGGLWALHLAHSSDLVVSLKALRSVNFVCYGADLQGTDVQTWRPRHPSALVLGSEAHGLKPAVHACLDECITVVGASCQRGTESLNVAVAAGILAYVWRGRPSA